MMIEDVDAFFKFINLFAILLLRGLDNACSRSVMPNSCFLDFCVLLFSLVGVVGTNGGDPHSSISSCMILTFPPLFTSCGTGGRSQSGSSRFPMLSPLTSVLSSSFSISLLIPNDSTSHHSVVPLPCSQLYCLPFPATLSNQASFLFLLCGLFLSLSPLILASTWQHASLSYVLLLLNL